MWPTSTTAASDQRAGNRSSARARGLRRARALRRRRRPPRRRRASPPPPSPLRAKAGSIACALSARRPASWRARAREAVDAHARDDSLPVPVDDHRRPARLAGPPRPAARAPAGRRSLRLERREGPERVRPTPAKKSIRSPSTVSGPPRAASHALAERGCGAGGSGAAARASPLCSAHRLREAAGAEPGDPPAGIDVGAHQAAGFGARRTVADRRTAFPRSGPAACAPGAVQREVGGDVVAQALAVQEQQQRRLARGEPGWQAGAARRAGAARPAAARAAVSAKPSASASSGLRACHVVAGSTTSTRRAALRLHGERGLVAVRSGAQASRKTPDRPRGARTRSVDAREEPRVERRVSCRAAARSSGSAGRRAATAKLHRPPGMTRARAGRARPGSSTRTPGWPGQAAARGRKAARADVAGGILDPRHHARSCPLRRGRLRCRASPTSPSQCSSWLPARPLRRATRRGPRRVGAVDEQRRRDRVPARRIAGARGCRRPRRPARWRPARRSARSAPAGLVSTKILRGDVTLRP